MEFQRIQMNRYQTELTEELINGLPQEVQDQLFDIINNVEFVKRLISPTREYAKDRPRDDKGRIIVDLANPHILEDMDYFRPTAIHYEKYGTLTNLRPNANPNSEYGKWIREERRRIWDGYVRESDGEWITGYMYWFLNYSPMMLSKVREYKDKDGRIRKSKRADRIEALPECWEGIYWRFHCLDQASNGGLYNNFNGGQHMAELASRGKGKSYSLASILSHIFVVGENETAYEKLKGIVTAYQKEYLTKDGVLNKFVDMANFCAANTQFPRKRLKNSLQEMTWIMGYRDVDLDIEMGTQNTVLGVSSKDDESKLRGKRAAKILIEEFGCHIKGTKVLMYDGSIKNVEDIAVGDILMGDDNTSRVVQELYNGTDQLYKITLSNGDYQIVNSHHPVYFKKYNWNNGTYTEHTLTAPELLEIKNLDKGYYIPKATIHFPYIPVAINPYFLGLWLGDGDSTRLNIANEDVEVLSWLSDNYEGTIRDLSQSGSCKVFHISKSTHVYNRLFSEYDLYNNKHVPQDYKVNAPEVQLQVIAGLIDTDGTYNSKKNFFEITQRYDRKHILDDVKFMCECNGLKCSMTSRVGTGKKKGVLHYRLRISGDLSIIPTKIGRKKGIGATSYKSRKCWNDYTFRVEPYKVDEYYGFTVDKNHLFVLGDLTITHNTFPRLVDLYNVLLPSVQEGDIVFGQIYMLGCVCAGTKVWTHNGRYINIEELKKEDGIIGFHRGTAFTDNLKVVSNGITREPIGKLIKPATKHCYRITLSNGNFIECSEDHPILVQTKFSKRITSYKEENKRRMSFKEDFKRANEIKVGDRVCECREVSIFGDDTIFDARLVGMLIGDGSYGTDNTPKYSSENIELLDYVKRKYDWGLSATHITKKGLTYEDIRIKGICSELREIGIYGQVKTCKRLPDNYQTLNRENTIDLLSGLYDTDGCIYSKGKNSYIGLTQSNKEILKQISILWRKFGVIGSIIKTKPTIKQGKKDRNPWYTLVINGRENLTRAASVLSLLVSYKRDKCVELVEWFNNNPSKKQCGYSKDYLVYKVTSIEDIGEQTIYNLSACASHTYLANNIITHNTAGDNESDFAGAQEIMYNPKGYNMYAIPNVYDKYNQGKPYFVFFFPGYVNRKGCYNEDGVSDVIKALIEILLNRYRVKYNSTDPNTIVKTIAEIPITPAEAIVKTGINIFPVADLSERLGQIDSNPKEFDDVYVGELIIDESKEVRFSPTSSQPIRDFPHKDNKISGAIEIYKMPEKDKSGRVFDNRYILGCDPYDDDESNTMSLGSVFVLDLWTDKIVAEYTGRPLFADDFYEICRKLCLFYSGRMNYENNKKGLFAYFSKMNCLYLLTDVLNFLKDKDMIKGSRFFGNKTKGTNATAAINAYAKNLLRSWLLAPTPMIQVIDGEEKEVTVYNLYTIRSRALIKELIQYNQEGNFDRISSMGMLMLLREDKMILYNGDISKNKEEKASTSYLGNDPFFKMNYDARFKLNI